MAILALTCLLGIAAKSDVAAKTATALSYLNK